MPRLRGPAWGLLPRLMLEKGSPGLQSYVGLLQAAIVAVTGVQAWRSGCSANGFAAGLHLTPAMCPVEAPLSLHAAAAPDHRC